MFERFALTPPGPQVEGKRVFLRPAQLDDWAEWARLRTESRDFLKPWEPTWPADGLTRTAYRRRLRYYNRDARDDVGYAFLVFRRSDVAMLGGVALGNIRRGVGQSCSVGYWIGKPHARQGYMTDALKAMVRFVFNDLGLHRLEAACMPNNEASKRLLRGLGFAEEGYARQYLCIDGVWRDHVLFALLSTDPRQS